jgi:hypothetical protein
MGGAACISCGEWKSYEELDGGHFIPTTYSSTRFDERNINAQCHRCNRFLHGNTRLYFRGMEAKYGRAVVDGLESAAGAYKWTRAELEQLKRYYKDKINDCLKGRFPSPQTDSGLSMSEVFSDISEAHGLSDVAPRDVLFEADDSNLTP